MGAACTRTVLVYGLAVSGEATARGLAARGVRVLVADDAPTDERRRISGELGTELIEAPDLTTIERLVRSVDAVAPAPGVPETHSLITVALANGVPLRTEIDLAYEWEQQRPGGPRPMIAITGTDGKTSTTLMVESMLRAAGRQPAAVGNTEVPLIAALDDDVDVFAVECSSFRLSWLRSFRAEAAIWLNLAPDHQNWHHSMASYESAKANVWRLQHRNDVAVGSSSDPVVMRHLVAAPARQVTFGLTRSDYRLADAMLAGPAGPFAALGSLPRQFPHDITNALAAAAACIESGLVQPDQIAAGVAGYRSPPHRIEPLGDHDGVRWYNDSKATSPHAALTAIRSFESLVLIAGGRNKGLDLSILASESSRIRAVVAIGESAAEIAAAFAGRCTVLHANSMDEAVGLAAQAARAGDAVVLSPACASFDWYPAGGTSAGGYGARGDDFRRAVAAHHRSEPARARAGIQDEDRQQ